MKKWVAFLLPLGCAIAAIALLAPASKPTASPTHVVAVYVDGLNNQDYRQACSMIHAPIAFPKMSVCEGFFSFFTALYGRSVLRVVPHSAKVWTETYRGREIRLAVVKYVNVTTPAVLTAHLRLIDGKWRIWAVTS